jgi:hypothetical protein
MDLQYKTMILKYISVRRASMHGGFVAVLFLALCKKKSEVWLDVAKTSHNRTVYASPPLAARSTVCLGHSAALHSHGKPPPHFAGTLCAIGLN